MSGRKLVDLDEAISEDRLNERELEQMDDDGSPLHGGEELN